ncbi:MAG: L,D-transpeptidase [Actinobacteria bacterium]|nr:L,D-transpeptidase [Actinomycetota bacterium]
MRLPRVIALTAVVGLVVAAPIAYGGDLDDSADGTGTATRGTAVQVADTQAPPSTELGDSLEIPANSGRGRRIVYSKGIQRVWLIEEDGTIYDTHRVSGRMDQPNYGTYTVWSRSEFTCSNAHSNICMRFMVRFAHSRRGDNIGFHEIPKRDGVPMQTYDQLGEPLSGGCVRQATEDAIVTWNWAQIGTVVWVVP